MKPLLQFAGFTALTFLLGCGGGMIKHNGEENAQAAPANVKIPVPVATHSKIIRDEKDLTGYWVGALKVDSLPDTADYDEGSVWDSASKINISIDAINGSQVSGHSIDSGIYRPFAGTVKQQGRLYRFSVRGPGDSKYDGAFDFSIRTGDSLLTGIWTSDQKIAVPVRYFSLTKKFFRYDPHQNTHDAVYVNTKKQKNVKVKVDDTTEWNQTKYAMATGDFAKLNASAYLLSASDIANLKAADLLLLRNYIFARHGYAFKKSALQNFFDQQDWYIPVSPDVTAQLTSIEKKNIALIQRYEKNAKEYYDTFGR